MVLSDNVITIEYATGWLLYNTINGQMIDVGDTMVFKSKKLDIVDKNIGLYLKENKYVKKSNVEDEAMYNMIVDKIKYSKDIMSFVIHTNYGCNLICPYCYQNQIKSNEKMNEETIKNTVKFINKIVKEKEPSQVSLCFIGGEPLMEWETIDIINRNLKIESNIDISKSLVTNGILLKDDIVDKLIDFRFNMIQITLDGSRKHHDNLRKNKNGLGSYDKIISNLKKYSKKLPISLNINLNSKNINSIEDVLSDLKNYDIKVKLAFSEIFDHAKNQCNNKLPLDSNQWFNIHKLALTFGYEFEPFYRNNNFVCGLYKENEYIIDPKGYLYKCISGVGLNQYKIGHINDINTQRVSQRIGQFVESYKLRSKCLKCEYKSICSISCHFRHGDDSTTCYKQNIYQNDIRIIREQYERELYDL